jgi:uroporphyrinogen-III synthase
MIAFVGDHGVERLLDRAIGDGRRRLLRLAGELHVPLSPPGGCTVETIAVYRAEPLELAKPAVGALRSGAVALLHSAEAARRFAEECDRSGLERERIAIACLGPRVAGAAGSGWSQADTASAPTDGALLVLARRMCQTAPSGVAHQR